MQFFLLYLSFGIIIAAALQSQAAVTDNSEYLIIPAGETYALSGSHIYNIEVRIDGTLYVSGYNGTHNSGKLEINSSVVIISSSGKMVADFAGYSSDQGPGKGENIGVWGSAGGGYGGIGGKGSGQQRWSGPFAFGGKVYGSITEPMDLGGGGGSARCASGGSGGGVIRLEVENLINNGMISSNGMDSLRCSAWGGLYHISGGGSGGSIYIRAKDFRGSGIISANGGMGYGEAGGGSGGRIAIYYQTQQHTGTITAYGGYGYGNGGAGSILGNGAILSLVIPTSDSTYAISESSATISKEINFTETLTVEKFFLNNLIATGTLQGIVNFADIEFIKIKTGSFAGKGITKGKWNAVLDGVNYVGEFFGVIFIKGNKTYLKGITEGIRGVIEGEIENGHLQFVWNFSQLDQQLVYGKLYLSGSIGQGQITEYSQVGLKITQSNIQGLMSGYVYYLGPVNSVFTHVKFNGNIPYKGEGFFVSSYETYLGNAQGWSYAKEVVPGITILSGLIGNPIYGLISGILNENVIPKTLLVNLERVDVELPPEVDLGIIATGPNTASPGGILSYSIQITNNGLKGVENITVIAISPQHTDFISASGNYTYYNVARWVDDKYAPTPFIRWNLPVIEPKSKIELNYQVRVRIGVAGPHEFLEGNAYIVPKQVADDMFAGYRTE